MAASQAEAKADEAAAAPEEAPAADPGQDVNHGEPAVATEDPVTMQTAGGTSASAAPHTVADATAEKAADAGMCFAVTLPNAADHLQSNRPSRSTEHRLSYLFVNHLCCLGPDRCFVTL